MTTEVIERLKTEIDNWRFIDGLTENEDLRLVLFRIFLIDIVNDIEYMKIVKGWIKMENNDVNELKTYVRDISWDMSEMLKVLRGLGTTLDALNESMRSIENILADIRNYHPADWEQWTFDPCILKFDY